MNGTTVERRTFGYLPNGQRVDCFTLTSEVLRVEIITFGATLVSVEAPDAQGKLASVVLGSYDLREYTRKDKAYLGAVCGRFANRIGGARVEINGTRYALSANEQGSTTLHGGAEGFDARNWSAEIVQDGVLLSLISPDGDQGFPGTLRVKATYRLQGAVLHLLLQVQTDAPTVANLTNHAYFNLDGEASGSIRNHSLQISAAHYLPLNSAFLPTGEIANVEQTPFDFRAERTIADGLGEARGELEESRGYNHTFALEGTGLRRVASVRGTSGRLLEILTTEPSLHLYSGGFLNGQHIGFSGVRYGSEAGLALETQRYPDSPNHPLFPPAILYPGETYSSETVWLFSAHDAGSSNEVYAPRGSILRNGGRRCDGL